MTKAEALENIRVNITTYGQHVYLVQGGPDPRFAYTIGLSEAIGVELIFAGGAFYSAKQVFEVIERLAALLRATPTGSKREHSLGELGTFSFKESHPTWSTKLILGALDYYKAAVVPALQIVPDEEHRTIDVPDLSHVRTETSEPIWQWLEKPWPFPVPQNTQVVTDRDALRGAPITEVARWEEADWEIFAGYGPDLDKEDFCVVPLGTLLGADTTLESIFDLQVGELISRDPPELIWQKHKWKTKSP